MYDGYLAIDGTEIANTERTLAYTARFLPRLNMKDCEPCQGLANAVGDTTYFDPRYDVAPWYRLVEPESADFYGFYPTLIQGTDDSSNALTVTELTTHGAVHSKIRHGSKDIRVRGLLIGSTREGVEAGRRWLDSVLQAQPCGRSYDCDNRTITFFSNCPGAPTPAVATEFVERFRRTMYRVAVRDGLRTVREYAFTTSGASVIEVEFVLNAGVPWAYSDLTPAVTTTGLTPTTVAEVSCPPLTDSYADLVLDPNDPALPQPPRPPTISVFTMPASWNRYMAVVPQSTTDRWGRLTPVVTITSKAAALRMVRVRFYQDSDALPGIDTSACGWEGEFLMTYIPAWSTVTINGITHEITLSINATDPRPAGHLVLGSEGRPVTWPEMACESPYLVVVDSEEALSDRYVLVQTAVGA